MAFPSSSSATFHARIAALWAGVASGSKPRAMAAFFPEAAYVQLKAIWSASSDFTNRLASNYGLDLAAAHAQLGPAAAHARLVGIEVPTQYAHWIPPGSCYNDVGYYEVPNSRLVYRAGGETRSIGIASMIAWRGEWYVIHFGAVDVAGVVDDPEPGTGVSVPSGTC